MFTAFEKTGEDAFFKWGKLILPSDSAFVCQVVNELFVAAATHFHTLTLMCMCWNYQLFMCVWVLCSLPFLKLFKFHKLPLGWVFFKITCTCKIDSYFFPRSIDLKRRNSHWESKAKSYCRGQTAEKLWSCWRLSNRKFSQAHRRGQGYKLRSSAWRKVYFVTVKKQRKQTFK